MTPKPTTSVERWNRAVHVAFQPTPEDLTDETLALSDQEVDAELVAAGVDLAAFDAEGDALYAQLFAAKTEVGQAGETGETGETGPEAWVSEAPPLPSLSNVVRIGSRRRNATLLAVAAVAAASAGGAAYFGSHHEKEKEKPAPVPSASAAPPPLPSAEEAPTAVPEAPKPAPVDPDSERKTRRR